MESDATRTRRWTLWLLLILSAAAVLRFAWLTDIPPGLTHDEADHGITAVSILQDGTRDLYFTIGYGREPLFDYATAVTMSLLGTTTLAGRTTAVLFSLVMVAGMALWVRHAFDGRVALLTAAGLAIGFWPLMSARQMLRSITLPAIFVLVVLVFWLGAKKLAAPDAAPNRLSTNHPLPFFALAGLLLGLTIYTYIPARALWVIFPLLLGYWALVERPLARRAWRWVLLMLGVAALVAAPLLHHVYVTNPTAEQRITDLSAPLTAVFNGNFTPLLTNIGGSLTLFTFVGDSAWRYNVAGRPFLLPLMGVLFYVGLGLALWYVFQRRDAAARSVGSASFLALSWLVVGFVPVLITGPELSMTQAIGVQPVLFLFPALALAALLRLKIGDGRLGESVWGIGLIVAIFVTTAVFTIRDYFMTWANAPEVRVQYESTMLAAIDYLNEQALPDAALSSITPDRFHSPAVAELTATGDTEALRWFDARGALLLPAAAESQLLIPGFTPLDPALERYATAEPTTTLPLRPTDLDRPLDVYTLDAAAVAQAREPFTAVNAPFGDALTLQGVDLHTPTIAPGGELVLATLWQVHQPLPDAVLFTHVQGAGGAPIEQADRLDAPGAMWRPGDWFIQIHRITLPQATPAGSYPLAVGVYTPAGGRLPLRDGTDLLPITTLEVTN